MLNLICKRERGARVFNIASIDFEKKIILKKRKKNQQKKINKKDQQKNPKTVSEYPRHATSVLRLVSIMVISIGLHKRTAKWRIIKTSNNCTYNTIYSLATVMLPSRLQAIVLKRNLLSV